MMSTVNLDAMEEDSFVHVGAPDALVMKVTPKYKIIGIDTKHATTQICVTITARELSDDCDQRSPVDIVVAVDVSGSMYGDKLELSKKTLELLLRVLNPEDRFGLVAYSSEAKVEFPVSKMTPENKEAAMRKIRSLYTLDCTNISAAIGLAFQEMRAIENPNEVRNIFLLTDGLANAGISDPQALVELTKNCQAHAVVAPQVKDSKPALGHDVSRLTSLLTLGNESDKNDSKPTAVETNPSSPPISISCFGYGSDHNSQLLRDMADATQGGTYYFVETDSGVGSAFGDAVGGLFSVVAQNSTLTIKVPPEATAIGAKIVKVHHDSAILRENGAYTVSVGDFYSEETRDVLVEVNLATPESPAMALSPIEHLSVSLAYTDVLEKKPVQLSAIKCTIQRPSGEELSKANGHVLAQWLRIMATDEMMYAETLANRGSFSEAKERLQLFGRKLDDCVGDIDAGNKAAAEMVQELSTDLKQLEVDFESRSNFRARGSHNMSMQYQKYKKQRMTAASSPSAPMQYHGAPSITTPRPSYTNSRKMALSERFDLSKTK